MKKNKIIGLLAILLLGCLLPLTSCSDEDNEVENIISYESLPSKAKTFLDTYFYGYEVEKVQQITGNGITVYEVSLKDGYSVVFGSEGEWDQVVAPDNTAIPSGIVPPVIQQYLNLNFNGYGVNKINRDSQGYKIQLVTGLNLYFNQAGELLDYGNDY